MNCLQVSAPIEDLDNGVIQISDREETIIDPVTYPSDEPSSSGLRQALCEALRSFRVLHDLNAVGIFTST
jgi:hypothetical protein